MINEKSVLAVIPARGGSKRLPNKNIIDLAGKPMIAWSIEAGLGSEYIDKVVVSSDSHEILKIAKDYGASITIRPSEIATDSATTIDVIKYTLKKINGKFDYIILLQPTSPLRISKHIDEAFELLKEKNSDAIVSVCEAEHSPLWANTLPKNDSMVGFINKDIINKGSQDLESYFRLNGAIYICKIEKLMEENSFFLREKIFAYKMDRESSVDVDNYTDLSFAKILMG